MANIELDIGSMDLDNEPAIDDGAEEGEEEEEEGEEEETDSPQTSPSTPPGPLGSPLHQSPPISPGPSSGPSRPPLQQGAPAAPFSAPIPISTHQSQGGRPVIRSLSTPKLPKLPLGSLKPSSGEPSEQTAPKQGQQQQQQQRSPDSRPPGRNPVCDSSPVTTDISSVPDVDQHDLEPYLDPLGAMDPDRTLDLGGR
jgi:hypothetical protein